MAMSFSGAQFAKALGEGPIRESIVRVGMAKKDEKGTAILFSEGTACEKWISIPSELIEEVEVLTTVACKDHEHPLVSIRFKEPPKDNDAARVFAEMARQSTTHSPIHSVSGCTTCSGSMGQSVVIGGMGQAGNGPAGSVQEGGTPDSIARLAQGGNFGGFGGFGLGGRCKCLADEVECHLEWIRYAPGKHIPVFVCTRRCKVWECNPR